MPLLKPDLQPDSALVSSSSPQRDHHTSDHLANERTFLAWIRTSISIIGLGFVVAKFSVWLRQLAVRFDQPVRTLHSSISLPLGVGMIMLGGVLALIAAKRYRQVRRAIDAGLSAADKHATTWMTIMMLAIAASLVTYMLATA